MVRRDLWLLHSEKSKGWIIGDRRQGEEAEAERINYRDREGCCEKKCSSVQLDHCIDLVPQMFLREIKDRL